MRKRDRRRRQTTSCKGGETQRYQNASNWTDWKRMMMMKCYHCSHWQNQNYMLYNGLERGKKCLNCLISRVIHIAWESYWNAHQPNVYMYCYTLHRLVYFRTQKKCNTGGWVSVSNMATTIYWAQSTQLFFPLVSLDSNHKKTAFYSHSTYDSPYRRTDSDGHVQLLGSCCCCFCAFCVCTLLFNSIYAGYVKWMKSSFRDGKIFDDTIRWCHCFRFIVSYLVVNSK